MAVAALFAPYVAGAEVIGVSAAGAAEPKCEFQDDIAALKAAQSPVIPMSTSTPVVDELALRKEILNKVIDCALEEARSLETGVKKVEVHSDDAKHLSEVILRRIQTLIRSYESLSGQLDDASEEKTRDLAKEVGALRKQEYAGLWEASRSFVVWNTNQELIDRASKRLSEIRQTLSGLKYGGNDQIGEIMERASVYLLRAKEANYRAMQSIERFESSMVLGHFKSTLDNLHDMYQTLISLSGALRAMR
jgi:hypothetical protein